MRWLIHYTRCFFYLCTEGMSLYAVPFYCKAFSRYARCFFHYVRWLFHYTWCFFHYIHGTSFSLDLKRGQLRLEVKMATTTRILRKLSLGHLTDLFHRDNIDIISTQRGTGGHDEFAIIIMLHTRIKGVSQPRNLLLRSERSERAAT